MTIDFDILRRPSSDEFLDEIQASHLFLPVDQSVSFFEIIISHLQNRQLSRSYGPDILRAIIKLISLKPEHMTIFLNHKFVEQIPNWQTHRSEFLNLLSILVDRSPDVFNATLVGVFSRYLDRAGEKSLILIAKYSLKVNDVSNPFPMLNILVNPIHQQRFCKPDIAGPYASLINRLVEQCPGWRREHGKTCWNLLLSLLELPETEVLDCVYDAFTRIAANIKRCKFPFEYVRIHATNRSHQGKLIPSILSLLLVVDLEGVDSLNDGHFLNVLIESALENRMATVALMRLALDQNIALMLAENQGWMKERLPDLKGTLQLFLVV
jgi:hypothetical protein